MPKLTVKSAKNREKGKITSDAPNLRDLPPIRDPIQIFHYDKEGNIQNARIIDFDNVAFKSEDEKVRRKNDEYDRYAGSFVYAFVTHVTLQFHNGESEVVKRVKPKQEKVEREPGEDVFG